MKELIDFQDFELKRQNEESFLVETTASTSVFRQGIKGEAYRGAGAQRPRGGRILAPWEKFPDALDLRMREIEETCPKPSFRRRARALLRKLGIRRTKMSKIIAAEWIRSQMGIKPIYEITRHTVIEGGAIVVKTKAIKLLSDFDRRALEATGEEYQLFATAMSKLGIKLPMPSKKRPAARLCATA